VAELGRTPYVIDRESKRVPYPLMSARGTKNTQTWWDGYQDALVEIRCLLDRSVISTPALGGGTCKLCHWHSHCRDAIVSAGDLTLIAELGRSKRDAMSAVIPTIHAFADCDPEAYLQKKKTIFSGIGADTLHKFHARARLLTDPHGKPYLTGPVILPSSKNEIYFDIEADPMHGIVYLHGFAEREGTRPEAVRVSQFFAGSTTPTEEEAAFRQAWAYLSARVQDSTIYYYSKYERTEYKKLAEKYPSICSVDEVEALFAMPAMIDLYFDVAKKSTEWPLYDQSIKTLAQYLGFKWRDVDPSGAASIEWYNRWLECGDPEIKRRILEYNEDDCLATGVVVDQIRRLPVKV
jgi:predicted RecB family nuclease